MWKAPGRGRDRTNVTMRTWPSKTSFSRGLPLFQPPCSLRYCSLALPSYFPLPLILSGQFEVLGACTTHARWVSSGTLRWRHSARNGKPHKVMGIDTNALRNRQRHMKRIMVNILYVQDRKASERDFGVDTYCMVKGLLWEVLQKMWDLRRKCWSEVRFPVQEKEGLRRKV